MKKRNMMKKFFAVTAACAMAFSLAACSDASTQNTQPSQGGEGSQPPASSTGEENTPAGVKSYKVAIIKQMDHASLDEIAAAVEARLDEIGAENGVTIEYTTTSGQGDQTILMQLADQAIADGVDAIIPIATTAAQVAAVSAEETKTPVVYAAISYPETADLTGIDYVTGTSDALDTQLILDMMLAQDPNVESVGLLYSLSEPNSEVPIAEAKAYLDEKGIAYTEQTANTNDEVVAAAAALTAAKVDAIFTPTDNVIMAAELAMKFSPEMRVNAIVPGFLLTNQNRALLTNEDGSYTDRARTIIAHTPAGRFAEPEELLGTIHYLVSDASSFVTGALAVVDGGFDAFSI